MRILILGAFEKELESITKKIPNLKETIIAKRRCKTTKIDQHDIVLSFSGLGTTAAASNTTAFCEVFDPDLIILCGVAGGLDADQQIGDLVVANKIIDADLYQLDKMLHGTPYEQCLIDPHTLKPTVREYSIEPSLLNIASSIPIDRMKKGSIVTSNLFPAPKEFFNDIKKMGCSAIEMESIGVFNAAQYYDIPVMTVRAISNLLNSSGEDLGTASNSLSICSDKIALFLMGLLNKIPALENITKTNLETKILDMVVKHDLKRHPEGGWYRQTYRSENKVISEDKASSRYNGEYRTASSSIIYLLSQGDFSAWHSVQSDETWYFHTGDSLMLRVINLHNGKLNEVILGTSSGLLQFTVKAGDVFSAETLGRFSLMSCMVTPGFDFKDFKLISNKEFLEKYPQHSNLSKFTRDKAVEPLLKKTALCPVFFNNEEDGFNHKNILEEGPCLLKAKL